jgi:hypothetical protein
MNEPHLTDLLQNDSERKRMRHELAESLRGRTVDEARVAIENAGMHMRVLVPVNGHTERTLEHVQDRCNVTVVNGTVASADIG